MARDLSIYVHVPFCVRKCLYCDFLSFNAGTELMDKYFSGLEHEIELHAEDYRDHVVKSVFFGGGTPSFPNEKNICEVLKQIKKSFAVDPKAEITIELNPGTASPDKLRAYREAGINRLSIGAQSMNDEELKRLGRIHDSKAFLETFQMARTAGFDNINVDVMSALPGQSLESYMDTLARVVSLEPEHISAYSLIVEEGTPFYDMELDLPSEEVDRQMYHETKRFLSEKGYHRYEISNYARDGKECYHNKVYWTRGDYLGVGLGAASMVKNVRWSNVRDIDSYLKATKLADIITGREELTAEGCMEEFMFLGLRLVEGVSADDFRREFGQDISSVYGDVIAKYREMELLEFDDATNRIRLTDKGFDVSNTVMADFLLE